MDMPRPNEAHRRLEVLAGSWKGEDTLRPSPWDPQGGKAIGRIKRRVVLDGFALVEDYEQERDGKITFRGLGVYTYDSKEERYVVYWWDTLGMSANVFRGQFQGKALVLECSDATGHSRITTELTAPGRVKFLMSHSTDGAMWSTCMESVYQKTG